MFERRLRILMAGVLLAFALVAGRAFQVQVVQRADWTEKADSALRRARLVDTIRGRILDVKGRPIAVDVGCLDACVEYAAIAEPPDAKWVREQARQRLRGKLEGMGRAQRTKMVDEESAAVLRDLHGMWETLGRLAGQTPEGVAEVRRAILQKVEMRRRSVWYAAYEKAVATRREQPKAAWYRKWVVAGGEDMPKVEDFEVDVGEQHESHPILRNITPAVANYISKNIEHMPGMEIKPGVRRSYPYATAACHLIGGLSRVSREDLERDADETDERRQYLANDQIGRGGLEGLAEPILRGRRGRMFLTPGRETPTDEEPAEAGADARCTIDIELQAHVQELLGKAAVHGAAVVIDIPTGEVRVLASYPVFDPNTLDDEYRRLADDEINLPLFNRATMATLEPGSTVKPMVGIAGVTEGVLRMDETIECTGYLVIAGKQQSMGRCWVATRFAKSGLNVAHHQIPSADPHPTGFLVLTDAIQRSCNVFFENVGDRLGVERLSDYMYRFGLGRETGIGIAEATGRVPTQLPLPRSRQQRRHIAWFAGIGQGKVVATPLQMANVAATIARDGVWARPKLLVAEPKARLRPTTRPEREDLGLSKAALAAAREGMTKVVNTRAGSGGEAKRADMLVAGKTGTAQAAPFTYRTRDAGGELIRDANGRPTRTELRLSTAGNVNPEAPWYRGTGQSGTDLAHAWFIGFAPADHPKVAFAVMVEYGGGGGTAAAPIAREVIQAAVEAGYLSPADAGAVGVLSPDP